MKPICATCRLFYRPKKNGVAFLEGMPTHDAGWEPYRLWHGDLWACQSCGSEIIVGVGLGPLVERHEHDFTARVESWKPIFQVNDC